MSSMVGLRDVLFVAPAADQAVIPLLSASPYHLDDRNSVTAVHHLWQHQHQYQQQQQQQQQQLLNANPNPNLRKPTAMPFSTLPTGTIGGGNIIMSSSMLQSSTSSGTTTCQDCGNQAKKDCNHRRCRTCCKGRGFDCSTHVKSTWVPAARRRETQISTSAAVGGGCNINVGSSGSTSAPKKPKLAPTTATSNTSNSNNTTPRSFDTSSSHQEESLPSQVKAPALFKCVRVTPVKDGEGEYAYQAMVRIGGHVFKGFLYDQGLTDRYDDVSGDQEGNTSKSNNNSTMLNLSELHLGGGTGGDGGNDMYAGGGGTSLLAGGTSFGNININ